ncbi:MAG TPA: hypothetical protein VMC79_13080, partial [Rectinemataceae bacterium]|nr:hypothetical protein [Rectinemataceae bacterium]
GDGFGLGRRLERRLKAGLLGKPGEGLRGFFGFQIDGSSLPDLRFFAEGHFAAEGSFFTEPGFLARRCRGGGFRLFRKGEGLEIEDRFFLARGNSLRSGRGFRLRCGRSRSFLLEGFEQLSEVFFRFRSGSACGLGPGFVEGQIVEEAGEIGGKTLFRLGRNGGTASFAGPRCAATGPGRFFSLRGCRGPARGTDLDRLLAPAGEYLGLMGKCGEIAFEPFNVLQARHESPTLY